MRSSIISKTPKHQVRGFKRGFGKYDSQNYARTSAKIIKFADVRVLRIEELSDGVVSINTKFDGTLSSSAILLSSRMHANWTKRRLDFYACFTYNNKQES